MNDNIDKAYHELIERIFKEGYIYNDPKRAEVQRLQINRHTITHDLTKNFPAITTKKLAFKAIIVELLWFLGGDTNIKYLLDHGVNIWNKDAYQYYLKLLPKRTLAKNESQFLASAQKGGVQSHIIGNGYFYGDLGAVYGAQWRCFDGVDQIGELVSKMIHEPMSTDLIVTAWDPSELNCMALPPCHYGFQVVMQPLSLEQRFRARNPIKFDQGEYEKCSKGKQVSTYLDSIGTPKYGFELVWQQRSVDAFLGLPFNIASYAVLAHIIGVMTNTVPLTLTGELRNVHLYDNSFEAAREQLKNDPEKYNGAQLLMKDIVYEMAEDTGVYKGGHSIIEKLEPNMFKLHKYNSYDAIKVPMLARSK